MKRVIAIFLLLFCHSVWSQVGQYMTVDAFQARFFSSDLGWKTLWVSKGLRSEIEQILGHRFTTLRLRYWGENNRTGWILEEIGKEQLITVGVVVENNAIVDITILEYRESRGGEVRYPFFTEQFHQVTLDKSHGYKLDKSIDGITGATLSVRALKKIATLALFCHEQTPFAQTTATASLSK